MRLLSVVIATLLLGGCVEHIAPYRAKRRVFDPGKYAAAPSAQHGSLFAVDGRGLFEDDTALRIGDVVIVRINENETATRSATTKLSKTSSRSASASGLLGTVASARGLDPTGLAGADSDKTFSGSGSIERQGRLSATLPARVRHVLPNGDLFIEGTKVIKVGAEEHHLYVSGIVRRRDLAPDGSVASSRLSDAEIEYTGRGDVSSQQRQGWLSRLMDKIWPF